MSFEFTPEMLAQISDAVTEGNKKSQEFKKETAELTALASAVTTLTSAQHETNNSVICLRNDVEELRNKVVDKKGIEQLIEHAIESYDYNRIKKKLEDKTKGEQSQQFVIEHVNPQDGVRAVKTPVHRNPYVTVPTSIGGGAAIIYLLIDLVLKHNGAG